MRIVPVVDGAVVRTMHGLAQLAEAFSRLGPGPG
jgi:hypothetical protein